MRLKYVKAFNVYSFPILEFFFNHRGTTAILGKNKDQDTDNGSGKTTIIKTTYLGLWGEELYSGKLDGVTHDLATNGWLIEIGFEDKGIEFKIIRFRNREERDPKSGVEFWAGDRNLTVPGAGGATATQKLIALKLKTSSTLFKSSVMTVQKDKNKPFLIASDSDKKEIFSELLDLTAFSTAFGLVKKDIDETNGKIKEINASIENIQAWIAERKSEIKNLEDEQDHFEDNKINRIFAVVSKKTSLELEIVKLKNASAELEALRIEKEQIDERIKEINQKTETNGALIIDEKEYQQHNVHGASELARVISAIGNKNSKIIDLETELNLIQEKNKNPTEFEQKISNLDKGAKDVEKILPEIQNHQEKVRTLVDYSKALYIGLESKNEEKIKDLEKKILELKESLPILEKEKESFTNKKKKILLKLTSIEDAKKENAILAEEIKVINNRLGEIQLKSGQLENSKNDTVRINSEIALLNTEVQNIKDEKDSFLVLIKLSTDKLDTLMLTQERNRKDIAELEEELKYLSFCKGTFSPEGIRSFIFDEILDLLNQKVQANLDDLYNGSLVVVFTSARENSKGGIDNKIGTKITFDGKSRDIEFISGGEDQRAVLAVDLALTEIAEVYSGTVMNIKFLDEPFNGIDGRGQNKFFKLFNRLAQSKEGFYIVSHDTSFQSLCSNAVYIIKEKGVSRIVDRSEFDPSSDTSNLFFTEEPM